MNEGVTKKRATGRMCTVCISHSVRQTEGEMELRGRKKKNTGPPRQHCSHCLVASVGPGKPYPFDTSAVKTDISHPISTEPPDGYREGPRGLRNARGKGSNSSES